MIFINLWRKQHKQWVNNNPDKMKVIKKNMKISHPIRITIYKKSAKTKKLEFSLTDEQCIQFFNSNCTLCNCKNGNIPMGIDRIDNVKGYIFNNCRAYCTMCNMIKGENKNDIIMERIKCILVILIMLCLVVLTVII